MGNGTRPADGWRCPILGFQVQPVVGPQPLPGCVAAGHTGNGWVNAAVTGNAAAVTGLITRGGRR